MHTDTHTRSLLLFLSREEKREGKVNGTSLGYLLFVGRKSCNGLRITDWIKVNLVFYLLKRTEDSSSPGNFPNPLAHTRDWGVPLLLTDFRHPWALCVPGWCSLGFNTSPGVCPVLRNVLEWHRMHNIHDFKFYPELSI